MGQFEAFCRGLARNRSIENLELMHRAPYGDRGGREFELLTPFFVQRNLKRLHIGDDFFPDASWNREGIQIFFKALSMFSSLTELVVNWISDYDDSMAMSEAGLLKPLLGHANLRTLNLHGNAIGTNGCITLARLLESSSALHTLCLGHVCIGVSGAAALAKGLERNSTLRVLDICHNENVTPTGWKAIFGALKAPKCALEEMDLSSCGLHDGELIHLAESLDGTTVKSLNLSFNANITSPVWQIFFVHLRSTESLEKLGLRDVDLSNDDALALGAALSVNNSLREINLSSNRGICKLSGWQAIAVSLENPNTALQNLDLRWNTVNTDAAATAFAQSLANNNTLRRLHIDGSSSITETGWNAFRRALCSNNALERIYVEGHLPYDVAHILRANEEASKSRAAGLLKTIISWPSGHMSTLLLNELGLRVIPYAIAWMGRDAMPRNGITLLYRFLQSMPAICCKTYVHAQSRRGRKRKRQLKITQFIELEG